MTTNRHRAEHLLVMGLLSLATTAFIGFLAADSSTPLRAIDIYLNNTLTLSPSSPFVAFYSAISALTDFWPIIFLLTAIPVYLALSSHRKESLVWFASLGAAIVLSRTLKYFFLLERPLQNITNVFGPAYPSGHATAASAIATLIIFSLTPRIKIKSLNFLVVCISLCIALAVSVSRLTLGAHWFSDVLGGVLLGTGVVLTVIGLSELFTHGKR